MKSTRHKIISIAVTTHCLLFIVAGTFATDADNRKFLLNYDIVIKALDDRGDSGEVQQIGVPFSTNREIIGRDFAFTNYIFTITSIEGNQGKLSIEFYRYVSRVKNGDPSSEYVTEVEFQLGEPAQLQTSTNEFALDLAFNIGERQ
jgi:hypothetical protein